jgi:manganese transport protein
MTDATGYDPYALPQEAIQDPPTTLWAALRKIGPGIILAGTIVGSGELLLTTSFGAKYGFVFLWLILFSCVIKVFVQTELGRYTISSGKPTLGAINELAGPRWGAHWMLWWWLTMMLLTIFQLGAMTGTIGQALNLAFPQVSMIAADLLHGVYPDLAGLLRDHPEYPWAVLTCLTAFGLLFSGNYKRIEMITTVLVVGVTLATVTAAMLLPWTPYPIPWSEVLDGLKCGLPDTGDDKGRAIAAGFAVFGITGVGAAELFYYPYWCLEKGYARCVGRCDASAAWERRAKGWIRVMYLDAWVSMIVFSISTVSFYFMGAAVLHPQGKDPQGDKMIESLSRMFVDTFGGWTTSVFLLGAGAVLFKTLYLSAAGNGRLAADFLSLSGAARYTSAVERSRVIHYLSLSVPVIALILFFIFREPKSMLVLGGFAQAMTLPIITAATIYFRYRKLDRRLKPSLILDILLWVAFILITMVSLFVVQDQYYKNIKPYFERTSQAGAGAGDPKASPVQDKAK